MIDFTRASGERVEILFPPSFVAAISKVPKTQIRIFIRKSGEDTAQSTPNPHDWFLDWCSHEGCSVMEDEPLAFLRDLSATTTIAISSPVDGVLTKILAKQGVVPFGGALAILIEDVEP